MAFSMLKIRRPLGRLIFNMGIAIPGKTVFLIETAPSKGVDNKRAWLKLTKLITLGCSRFATPSLRQNGCCRCLGTKQTPGHQQAPYWLYCGNSVAWIISLDTYVTLQLSNNVLQMSESRNHVGFFVINEYIFSHRFWLMTKLCA